MLRILEVAEYSTVDPEFNVGVERFSSPMSFKVAELATVNVPTTVKLRPFKSKLPADCRRLLLTIRLFVVNCRVPAPECVRL